MIIPSVIYKNEYSSGIASVEYNTNIQGDITKLPKSITYKKENNTYVNEIRFYTPPYLNTPVRKYEYQNLLLMISETSEIECCGRTADKLIYHTYGGFAEKINLTRYFKNDMDAIIEDIIKILDKNHIIGISLLDARYDIETDFIYDDDYTLDHAFILIKAIDGKIYMISSYVGEYCTTMVPFFLNDLYHLLHQQPGSKRVELWNKIFNSHETKDERFPFIVSLMTSSDNIYPEKYKENEYKGKLYIAATN